MKHHFTRLRFEKDFLDSYPEPWGNVPPFEEYITSSCIFATESYANTGRFVFQSHAARFLLMFAARAERVKVCNLGDGQALLGRGPFVWQKLENGSGLTKSFLFVTLKIELTLNVGVRNSLCSSLSSRVVLKYLLSWFVFFLLLDFFEVILTRPLAKVVYPNHQIKSKSRAWIGD